MRMKKKNDLNFTRLIAIILIVGLFNMILQPVISHAANGGTYDAFISEESNQDEEPLLENFESLFQYEDADVILNDVVVHEPGDVNMDGRIDVSDAIKVLRYIVGLVELTPEQILLANVSGSGSVNVNDAILTLRYIVGLIDSLPYTVILASLTLSGTPDLTYSGTDFSFDLNDLTLAGTDQFGDPYDISGEPVTWTVVSGPAAIDADDHTLTITNSGMVTVNAAAHGVTSNSLELTVEDSTPIPVSALDVTPEEMTLLTGGSPGTITATVSPDNATNKNINWISDDETVATVADGVVTPLAAGNAVITATTEDGGFTGTTAVTVYEEIVGQYQLTFSSAVGGTTNPEGSLKLNEGETIAIEALADMGYTFTGWSASNGEFGNFEESSTFFTMPETNVTVTANFIINEYTVTFNDHDGVILKEESVEHSNAATAPADPERDGYTFTGWDADFDNVTSDLNITAEFAINEYTVTFNDHDGVILKEESVEHGNAATAPAHPEREGHTFTGWDVDFSDIKSNIEVTAVYEEIVGQYQLTFSSTVGGTTHPEGSLTLNEDETIAIEALAEMGYTFTGWSASNGEFGNFEESSTFFTMPETNVTVIANFIIIEYTVKFNDHEGIVLKEESVEHGNAATAPDDPERDGYTFTGWDADFDNVTSDLIITAEFAINEYTVTFKDHDGEILKEESVEHGNAATAPADPEREGHTFTGWDVDFSDIKSNIEVTAVYEKIVGQYQLTFSSTVGGTTHPEGSLTLNEDETIAIEALAEMGYTFTGWSASNGEFGNFEESSTFFTMPETNVTVTANFIINEYTVTFKDHDGEILKEESVEHGNAATAPADPEREGHTFIGWNTQADGSGTEFTSSTPVLAHVTVHAQWTTAPELTSLTLSGSPNPIYNGADLSGLTLEGKDQYGQTFDISDQTVTWAVNDGPGILNFDGHTLTFLDIHAAVTVNASINSIASNQIEVTDQTTVTFFDQVTKVWGWWENTWENYTNYGLNLEVKRSAGYVNVYYVHLPEADPAPTVAEVINIWVEKRGTSSSSYIYSWPMRWGAYPIVPGEKYTMYAVAEYSSENWSEVEAVPVRTNVTGIVPPEEVSVIKGTSLQDVQDTYLSNTVTVILGNSLQVDVDVNWDGATSVPAYDPNVEGTYTFTGTLALPGVLTNPHNLQVEIMVNVVIPVNFFISGYPQTEIFHDSVNLLTRSVVELIDYKYVVLPDNMSAPTVQQVLDGQDADGSAAAIAGWDRAVDYQVRTHRINNLSPATTYNIYIVGYTQTDTSEVQVVTVTTASGPDNITAVADLPDIHLQPGEWLYNVDTPGLADKVRIDLSDGSWVESYIQWEGSSPEYDSYTPGTYVFSGSVGLPQGVANPDDLKATQKVIVADTLPPEFFSGYPNVENTTTDGINLTLKVNEDATGYYVLQSEDTVAPDTAQVMAGQNGLGESAVANGQVSLTAATETVQSISGLNHGRYKVYVVAKDIFDNKTQVFSSFIEIAPPISDLAFGGRDEDNLCNIFFNWTPPENAESVVLYAKEGDGEYTRANYTIDDLTMKTASSVTVNGIWDKTYTFKLVVTGGPNAGESNEVTLAFGFGGGSGTEADPYLITNVFHLDNIRYNWNSIYKMAADIDLGTAPYNSDLGWAPIEIFTGTFDGNGHTISNLFIDQPGSRDVGFFGYLNGGKISNLQLTNVNVNGWQNVGSLVGYNYRGNIENCSVTGQLSGLNGSNVGGLVGLNEGYLLAGLGVIDNSYVVMDVVKVDGGGSNDNFGGLVGKNVEAKITASHAQGTVNGGVNTGGLVGINIGGEIIDSFSNNTVSGTSQAGGLVGKNDGDIKTSYAIGTVSAGEYTGGLVGISDGTIQDSYAVGDVTGVNYAGGLVGLGTGGIDRSYASGIVNGASQVGGLAGESRGSISNSYATGDITASGGSVGGLVGKNMALVANSYVTGNVTGAGPYVGGLAGNNGYLGENQYYSASIINNSFALNSSITRTDTSNETTFGRLAGASDANSQALSDNRASGEMTFTGIDYTPVSSADGKDGKDITFYSAKSQAVYQQQGWGYGPYSYSWAPWQMPADGYPLLRWQPVEKAIITGISASNGIITISFNSSVSWLTLNDINITASLNGSDYTLERINLHHADNKLTFIPVTPSNVSSLEITIGADELSTKVTGIGTVVIDTQIGAAELALSLKDSLELKDYSVAIVLKSAGFSAQDSASALHSVYENDNAATALALKTSGYGASEIAEGLYIVYGDGNQAAVTLLKQWFGAKDIAVALNDIYENTDSETTQLLASEGFDVNDISGAVKSVFAIDETEAAELLKNSGFTALEISTALRITYSIFYDRIIPALNASGSDINELVEVLQAIGFDNHRVVQTLQSLEYSANDLASVLQSAFSNTAAEAMHALQYYPIQETVIALKDIYGLTGAETAQMLKNRGYGALSTAKMLQEVFEHEVSDVANALQTAEFAQDDIASALTSSFDYTSSTISALEGLGWNIADIAALLQNRGSSFFAQLLQEVGHTSSDIAALLKDVFGESTQTVVSDLKGASFDAVAVATALKEVFTLDGATAAPLIDYSYDHLETGIALKEVYDFTNLQTAHYLRNNFISASTAAAVLKDGYQDDIVATSVVLYKVGFSGIAEALRDAYAADDVLATETLKVAGLEEGVFWNAGSIFNELVRAYETTDDQTLELLLDAGFSLNTDIADAFPIAVSNGDQRTALALKTLEYNLDDIANFLKAYYDNRYAQPANVLKATGYSAVEITGALKDIFAYDLESARDSLWAARFDFTSIISALKDVYGAGGASAAQDLKDNEHGIEDIALTLKTEYDYDAVATAVDLHIVGFTAQEIAVVLKDPGIYAATLEKTAEALASAGFEVVDIAPVLKNEDIWNADAQETALLANKSGFSVLEVAGVLFTLYDVSEETDAATVLNSAGFGSEGIALSLKDIYNVTQSGTAQVLFDVGYDAANIALALKSAYASGSEDIALALQQVQVDDGSFDINDLAQSMQSLGENYAGTVQILQSVGYDISSIADSLRDVFRDNQLMAVKGLKDAGLDVTDIALALHEAWSSDAQAVMETLKTAGYAVADLAAALDSVFAKDSGGIIIMLQSSGYGTEDIADALESVYTGTDDGTATAVAQKLLAAEISMNNIALALKNTFGDTSMTEVAQFAKDEGYDVIAVAVILKDIFNQDEYQAVQVFKAVGFSLNDAALAIFQVYSMDAVAIARAILNSEYGDDVASRARGVAAALKNLGYSSLETIEALRQYGGDRYALTENLRYAGFGLVEVLEALQIMLPRMEIPFTPNYAANTLYYSNYDADEIVSGLISFFPDSGADTIFSAFYGFFEWQDILNVLVNTADATDAEMLQIMMRAGKGLREAAQVLKDYYDLDAVDTIILLKNAGYSGYGNGIYEFGNSVAVEVFGYALADVLGVLIQAGFSNLEVAEWLATNIGSYSNQYLTDLQSAGYTINDIVAVLKAHGYSAAGSIYRLHTLYSLENLTIALRTAYDLTALDATNLLVDSRQYTLTEINATVISVYNMDPVTVVLQHKKNSGASAYEALRALNYTFSITDPLEVAGILKNLGYSENEVLNALWNDLPRWSSGEVMVRVVRDLYMETDDANIIAKLLTVWQSALSSKSSANALYKLGFGLEDTISGLKDVNNLDAGQIFEIYLGDRYYAGLDVSYSLAEIFTAVGNTFELDELDTIYSWASHYKQLGASAAEVLSSLSSNSLMDSYEILTFLKEVGYTQGEVVNQINCLWNHNERASIHALLLTDVYEITDPAQITMLLKGRGRYDINNVSKALQEVFTDLNWGDVLLLLNHEYSNYEIYRLLWHIIDNIGADDSVAAVLSQTSLKLREGPAHYLISQYSLEEAVEWFMHNDYPLADYGPEVIGRLRWNGGEDSIKPFVDILKNKGYTIEDIAKMFVVVSRGGNAERIVQSFVISDLYHYGGYTNISEIAGVLLHAGGGYEDMIAAFPSASQRLSSSTAAHGYGYSVSSVNWSGTDIAQAVQAAGGSMQQIANGFVRLSDYSYRARGTYFAYYNRAEVFNAIKAIQGPSLDTIHEGLSSAQSDLAEYLPDALPFAALRMAGYSVTASMEMAADIGWGWKAAVANLAVAGYSFDAVMSAAWDVYRDAIGADIIMTMFSSVFTGSLFLDLARYQTLILSAIKMTVNLSAQ